MIADEISPAELRALLTIRRAELESTVAESYARLAQVESRLRGITGDLPSADVVIKELPAIRLVGLTTTAASFTPEDISPVVRPLCDELGCRLPDADVRPVGRLTCLYERSRPQSGDDEDEVVVRATVPATVDTGSNLNGADSNQEVAGDNTERAPGTSERAVSNAERSGGKAEGAGSNARGGGSNARGGGSNAQGGGSNAQGGGSNAQGGGYVERGGGNAERRGGNLNGLEVIDLPAVRVATLVYRGPIDQVLPAWQALARWIDDNGYRSGEPARELYLDCPEDPAGWVTELQEPIEPSSLGE
ncbi:GyrI-like domain-containing protein [Kribbella sp. NBC_00359]|uniref:GyrI-like domain-containing protein n=1 Tax=Kribbella sp. NBC_00359 TaxID=2975966 RepID=UPI002E234AAF